MGSPGVFIHSGTLGGRFSEVSVAANASLPATPLATAPPINAPPRRRNVRRDATGRRSSAMLAGSVIVRPPLSFNARIAQSRRKVIEEGVAASECHACLIVVVELELLARDCCSGVILFGVPGD